MKIEKNMKNNDALMKWTESSQNVGNVSISNESRHSDNPLTLWSENMKT